MNERIQQRFALIRAVLNDMDYANMVNPAANEVADSDEYDAEAVLLSLAAAPGQGLEATAVLVGFVFSYAFNDEAPRKDWCYAVAEVMCARILPRHDDPEDCIKAVQNIIERLGIEPLLASMQESLAQANIQDYILPHVVMRLAVKNAALGLENLL